MSETKAPLTRIIQLNGSIVQTPHLHLYELLKDRGLHQQTGIAVAINQSIVPRSLWSETTFNEGDQILIITAAAGG